MGQRPLAVLIYTREEIFANRYASQRPYRNRTDGKWHGSNWSTYDLIHNDGANLLFCDGHAKWMKKSQIRSSHLGLVVTPDRALSTDATTSVNEGNTGLPAAF